MAKKPLKPQGRYLSYLLRLWRENGGETPLWRASLEEPPDGEPIGFASLVDLFDFLMSETRVISPGQEQADETPYKMPDISEKPDSYKEATWHQD